MSELKPDSEKKEERLSDKEKVNTEKTNAEELNAEEPNAEKPNTEEINEEPPAASEDEDFFFDDNKAYEAVEIPRSLAALRRAFVNSGWQRHSPPESVMPPPER